MFVVAALSAAAERILTTTYSQYICCTYCISYQINGHQMWKKGAQCETGHNKGPARALIWVVLTHSKLLVILNPFLHIERIKVWMEILDFFYMNIEEEKMTRYFQALYLVHCNCWINDQNLLPKAKLRWAGLVLHKRCNLTTNFRIAFSW